MSAATETPLQFMKGVGESRAEALAEHGLRTQRDLLWYFPYRYEDRRNPVPVARIGSYIDTPIVLRGRVISASLRTTPRKRFRIFEAAFEDGTGGVKVVWFNQPFLAKQITRGDYLSLYGAPKRTQGGHIQIESPDWEKIDPDEEGGAIVPIYSKVPNVPPKTLRKIIAGVAKGVTSEPDPLPDAIRERLGVIPLGDALRELHLPSDLSEEFLRFRSPAHLRVILQEFFAFQLALRVRRAGEETALKERRIVVDDRIREEVRKVLPFRLTGAQKRVLREIATDLQSPKPMYRLLQGDVGSGKTIVALIAALLVIRNGHQAALLAPTEILAEQHLQRLRQLVDGKVTIAKATGSMTAGERRTLVAGLREGVIELVVGTHALLEERLQFKSLGLAIVDEQHRFGVEQRQKLFAKGDMPDILVMTATPIPRSLALATYGDLELSVIDQLPPGRQQITTAVRASSELERVYAFIDREVADGAQVYIVYPLIEESQKLDVKALGAGFEIIRSRFAKRRVAMMHGRMSAAEKDETMRRFKAHEIDILVSTTVIEVGIDVANASIMLILDADRFGLSQLHQLRGRVGRGTRKSWCILEHDDFVSQETRDRLTTFAATRDGFEVAELDLQVRGPGEFLGTRQSGMPRFHFGNILRDHDLMEAARDAAIEVIEREGPEAAARIVHALLGARVEQVERD